jgi:hypothetical protein
VNQSFDPLYPAGLQWYWRADFVKELGDEAIARHAKHGAALPTMHSTMHLYAIDGAAHRVGRNETAFSYRDANWAEYSTGAKRIRGAITIGNAHLRRVLVESARHYRHHPFLGDALRRRQCGVPNAVIEHAWLAQRRLHRRYPRLAARGKPKPLIVTPVARELTRFLWAALTH